MKSLNDLANLFEKLADNIDKNMVKANEKTAQKVYDDIIANAPGTGAYRESIKIYPTEIKNDVITTFIGSDLVVENLHGPQSDKNQPAKGFSNNAPAGTKYNLGYLLEHGTAEHAIPNAFGRGYHWNYTDSEGNFYKGTLEPDWHPGSTARQHYSIALIKNKKFYKDNIKLAWRGK